MNRKHTTGLIVTLSVVLAVVSVSAQGVPVLQGRDLDGNPFTAEAYYDPAGNLTWLANAGAAADFWPQAMAWATSLNVGGVTGWRLPASSDGCLGFDCASSEMGNMFFNILGGVALVPISSQHNSNYNLFHGLQDRTYWSSTEYVNQFFAMVFGFHAGKQDYVVKSSNGPFAAWPVHSGDVGAHVVMSASEGLKALPALVMGMNLKAGISNALDSKLSNALGAVDDDNANNDGGALQMVYAFCHSSEAQRGTQLTDAQVDTLIAAADVVIGYMDTNAAKCK